MTYPIILKKMELLIDWLNKLRKNSTFQLDLQESPKNQAYNVLSDSLLLAMTSFKGQERRKGEGEDQE